MAPAVRRLADRSAGGFLQNIRVRPFSNRTRGLDINSRNPNRREKNRTIPDVFSSRSRTTTIRSILDRATLRTPFTKSEKNAGAYYDSTAVYIPSKFTVRGHLAFLLASWVRFRAGKFTRKFRQQFYFSWAS